MAHIQCTTPPNQLLAHLKHLTLCGYNKEENKLEWVGTSPDWDNVSCELGEVGEQGEHDCLVGREESAGCVDDTGTCMTCGKTDLI